MFLFLAFQLSAQKYPQFKAGLLAGLNFAELEGDGLTDYFGPNTGVMTSIQLNRGLQFSTEILFSQNGEYVLPAFYPRIRYGAVRLNHIEVPIHFDVLIQVFQKGGYADWQLHFGGAYARLFGHFAEDYDGVEVTNEIVYDNLNSFHAQFGTTYFFAKKWGLNLKASLPLRLEGLAWTVAARAVYIFSS